MTIAVDAQENNIHSFIRKEGNAGIQHVLLFQKCSYPSTNKFQFLSPIYFVVC